MIGIIGGSGFYTFMGDAERIRKQTPYGDAYLQVGSIGNQKFLFIPRHGKGHSRSPGKINYQANIAAAADQGVDMLLVTNAVGSINPRFSPGDYVVPHDILDFTVDRAHTFSKEWRSHKRGSSDQPVFGERARRILISSLREKFSSVNDTGVLVVTSGPRFETPAEIEVYRRLGADWVGMTTAPEVFLAQEVGIEYATLAVVTNYAAGLQSSLSDREVFDLFSQRMDQIQEIMRIAVENYAKSAL